jgi:hypothetical protein
MWQLLSPQLNLTCEAKWVRFAKIQPEEDECTTATNKRAQAPPIINRI